MAHEPIELPELDEDPKNDYWAPEVTELELTEEERRAGEIRGRQTREVAW